MSIQSKSYKMIQKKKAALLRTAFVYCDELFLTI